MSVFPAIRIEGGLLGPDTLDILLSGDPLGQKPRDFGLDGRRSLTDEIASVFADARTQWEIFRHRLERLPETDPGTSVTRDAWMIPFLSLLGYELRYNPRAYEVAGATFAISHRAGEAEEAPPVHIVGARQELGRVAATGRPRLAPHSLVQEFLNRTEHLWGIVTNGTMLRLLRDSTYIRRQAYVEFDLAQILDEQRFTDFAVLYRLLHRTRLPQPGADPSKCLLEQYYQHAIEQGGRVRERLRDGVEECLKQLANGFLAHPANDKLRNRALPDYSEPDRLAPEDLYRQLLRLVYRRTVASSAPTPFTASTTGWRGYAGCSSVAAPTPKMMISGAAYVSSGRPSPTSGSPLNWAPPHSTANCSPRSSLTTTPSAIETSSKPFGTSPTIAKAPPVPRAA